MPMNNKFPYDNWYIKVTKENLIILTLWCKSKSTIMSSNLIPNFIITYDGKIWWIANFWFQYNYNNCEEITIDQFKKYILNAE